MLPVTGSRAPSGNLRTIVVYLSYGRVEYGSVRQAKPGVSFGDQIHLPETHNFVRRGAWRFCGTLSFDGHFRSLGIAPKFELGARPVGVKPIKNGA
jgi:hypothetical protein